MRSPLHRTSFSYARQLSEDLHKRLFMIALLSISCHGSSVILINIANRDTKNPLNSSQFWNRVNFSPSPFPRWKKLLLPERSTYGTLNEVNYS